MTSWSRLALVRHLSASRGGLREPLKMAQQRVTLHCAWLATDFPLPETQTTILNGTRAGRRWSDDRHTAS
jgi:hypothetical protein